MYAVGSRGSSKFSAANADPLIVVLLSNFIYKVYFSTVVIKNTSMREEKRN